MVCRCQPVFSMISAKVGPFFRWSMTTIWGFLLLSCGAVASCVLAARLPLGSFLAVVAFLLALPFVCAPWADCAPRLALRVAFGFAGCPRALRLRPRSWILF
jgi:hypothetical protein